MTSPKSGEEAYSHHMLSKDLKCLSALSLLLLFGFFKAEFGEIYCLVCYIFIHVFAPELKTSGHARASFGQLKKQSHASAMVKYVFADAVLCLFRNVGVCGGAHCPASHLEADLPGPSKQGL